MRRSSRRSTFVAAAAAAILVVAAGPAIGGPGPDPGGTMPPCFEPRSISVSDASFDEGSPDAATSVFTFSVTSSGCFVAGTVTYQTRLLSAAAGNHDMAHDTDLLASTGALTFDIGDASSRAVRVAVVRDAIDECHEKFALDLQTPSPGIALADPVGIGTIHDDDGLEEPLWVRGHCGD